MTNRLQYSIGVAISYIFVLIAIHYLDFKVTTVFLSFAIEYALVTVLYSFVNTFFNRTIRTKTWSIIILVTGFCIISFQGIFIALIADKLNEFSGNQRFFEHVLSMEVLIVVCAMAIAYIGQTIFIYGKTKSMNFVADNYFKKGFILFAVTTLGAITVFVAGAESAPLIVAVVIFIRLYLEFHFNKGEAVRDKIDL